MFSAHFSKLTVTTAPPLKGFDVGKPYCSLALTVAAVFYSLIPLDPFLIIWT